MTATSSVQLIEDVDGAVGFVNPGVSVEIVDDAGNMLPRGSEGVTECAVFGAQNELGNEEVFAIVVAGNTVDDAKLRAHCETKMSRQFVPVKFIRTDRLPRNAMGKVDRGNLRNLLN